MSCALTSVQIEQLFLNVEDARAGQTNFQSTFMPVVQSFQNDDNQKAILSYINKLLITSANRDKGFKYLNVLLLSCSLETLSDNGVFWIGHAVGQIGKGNVTTEALNFLANIVPICHDIQHFNKTMMSTYLSKIIEICTSIQLNSIHTESALACLEACLQMFPSTCGPMKNRTELYLLKFLDSPGPENVRKAGRCYHFLQQVGGAGAEGIIHVNNWSDNLRKLCKTMHTLYDQFFEHITEFENYDQPDATPFEFPEFASDVSNVEMLFVTENRLKNVSIFIQMMLQTKFPVAKVIIPKYVLEVVKRSLSVHVCAMSKNNSVSLEQFNVLLMKHQIDSLYLLRSCIAVLRYSLIPFSPLVTKLILDCLRRPKNCACFNNSSKYKETVYTVLTYWIALLKNNLSSTVHEKLILSIIDDISPIRSEVFLSMTSKSNTRTANRKIIEDRILSSGMSSVLKDHTRNSLNVKEKNCCQALECLTYMFKNVYVTIKPNVLKVLYTAIIKTLLRIQNGKIVHPYSTVNSEMRLYEALLAVIDRSYSIMPPPIEMAINVFAKGQSNTNYCISEMCTSGLSMLEKVCQPICPTLNLANIETQFEREEIEGEVASVNIVERISDEGTEEETESSEINLTLITNNSEKAEHVCEVSNNDEQNKFNETQINNTENMNVAERDNGDVTENTNSVKQLPENFTPDKANISGEASATNLEPKVIASENQLEVATHMLKDAVFDNKIEVEVTHDEKDKEVLEVTQSEDQKAQDVSEISRSDEREEMLDAPQCKKAKYDESIEKENGEEDDMMNSFIDVVNDY